MCTFGLSGFRVKPWRRAPTLRAPTLRGPTLRAPTLRTPNLGPLLFLGLGPTPLGPRPFRPPFLPEALRASTFSGFGPLRSSFLTCCSFVLVLCIFNCFYFLTFFFFKKITVFLFVFFKKKKKGFFQIFHFFKFFDEVGRGGKPKPQTSFQFFFGGRYDVLFVLFVSFFLGKFKSKNLLLNVFVLF